MVSGSGVATTVTLGSVSWPLMRRAGYPAEVGGAILSASGIGAIMAPPVMGAAAFLIAEFLAIPYFEVMVMAIIPTCLYYLSALLMIETDARRLGTQPVEEGTESARQLVRRFGYHFVPLIAIVFMLARGFSPFRAVVVATLFAVVLSFVRSETRLGPRKVAMALASGANGTLSVVATCATAGIIVGVVTLTGLGLRVSGLVVDMAGGSAPLTILFAAVAVWMLGLAVPVTASYIIAAVMVAPALTSVGVPVFAAHMFIFYYAVLSEVTPPTALSPFAAAAITGGNPYRTMMLTWKYTLPAFLVPFLFTLTPSGLGLLLKAPLVDVVWATSSAAAGTAALAVALGGWAWGPLTRAQRVVTGAAGALFFYGSRESVIAGAILAVAMAFIIARAHSAELRTNAAE
jgi:TRAP transporter 4TM/12TM fusion protein